MRNWTGLVLILIGAWLSYSGLAHRNRVLALRREAPAEVVIDERRQGNSSLAVFGDVLRPLIIIGLCYFALKVTLAYVLLDGGRFFSAFDLAGLLFLLAAYATWLTLRTTYREAIVSGAATPLQHGPIVMKEAQDDMTTSPSEFSSRQKQRALELQT